MEPPHDRHFLRPIPGNDLIVDWIFETSNPFIYPQGTIVIGRSSRHLHTFGPLCHGPEPRGICASMCSSGLIRASPPYDSYIEWG